MQIATMLTIATAGFTTYPGFGDKLPGPAQPAPQQLRIESIVDRGPIVEMVIRCGANAAIISYSKVEKLYCSPKLVCDSKLDKTLALTCGR